MAAETLLLSNGAVANGDLSSNPNPPRSLAIPNGDVAAAVSRRRTPRPPKPPASDANDDDSNDPYQAKTVRGSSFSDRFFWVYLVCFAFGFTCVVGVTPQSPDFKVVLSSHAYSLKGCVTVLDTKRLEL
ncbi:hypothetical protein SO802_035318 [Lithocarpus litseifolius]|uniref:Uncharacterized protein n=1 Tax=Lithocarpus litseifolius TaxID=425828 RepID=A0AAW2B7F5_9ROSI